MGGKCAARLKPEREEEARCRELWRAEKCRRTSQRGDHGKGAPHCLCPPRWGAWRGGDEDEGGSARVASLTYGMWEGGVPTKHEAHRDSYPQ